MQVTVFSFIVTWEFSSSLPKSSRYDDREKSTLTCIDGYALVGNEEKADVQLTSVLTSLLFNLATWGHLKDQCLDFKLLFIKVQQQ